jgi:hypothetical protein
MVGEVAKNELDDETKVERSKVEGHLVAGRSWGVVEESIPA